MRIQSIRYDSLFRHWIVLNYCNHHYANMADNQCQYVCTYEYIHQCGLLQKKQFSSAKDPHTSCWRYSPRSIFVSITLPQTYLLDSLFTIHYLDHFVSLSSSSNNTSSFALTFSSFHSHYLELGHSPSEPGVIVSQTYCFNYSLKVK